MAKPAGTANNLRLRSAGAADAAVIHELILALADYEKLRAAVVVTVEDLSAALAGTPPAVEVILAEWLGEVAGFALYFHNFSTFAGRRGLYLEDLFIRPEYRGHGIGLALLTHLATLAVKRGCARMEWVVLDWNRPAIDFYSKLGARPLADWTLFRLDGTALSALADRARQQ